MASSGAAVADSNPDPDNSIAVTGTVPPRPSPKPEVARKPQVPGSKPCPPVPKKPPVAHKPTALSARNGDSGVGSAPPTLPKNLSAGTHTSSSIPSKLPPAQPSTEAQGGIPPPAALSKDPKTGGKVPPPPLPKAPPKGAAGKPRNEPPPRPTPPVKKAVPPPVPAKKPFAKKPVLRELSDESSSLPMKQQLDSHEHSGTSEIGEKHQSHSDSVVKNPVPTPKRRSYQQVIVEDSSDKGDKEGKLSDKRVLQRQSYENVQIGKHSQGAQLSCPSKSREQGVEEEVPQSDSCEPIARHADVENFKDETDDVQSSFHGTDDHQQNLVASDEQTDKDQVSEDGTDSKTQLNESQIPADSVSKLKSYENNCSSNNFDHLLDKRVTSVHEDSDQLDISSKYGESSHDSVEKSSIKDIPKEKPLRPSTAPPPVRPKPRKRVSLVKQTGALEEDTVDPPSVVADVAECHSSSINSTVVSETSNSYVQEAVCEEVEELKSFAKEGTDSREEGNVSDVERISALVDQEAYSSEGGNKSPDSRKEDKGQITDKGGNGDVKSQNLSVCTEQTFKDSDVNSIDNDISSKGSREEVRDDEEKVVSRKSPEKQGSVNFEDVEETSFMLKEIEQLLNVRLGSTEALADPESKPEKSSDGTEAQANPVRPPRPRRADRLRKLTIGSCSADNSSTESLTSVGLSGKKAPPKPKRKRAPGAVNRSLSDVTGLKEFVDQLEDNKEDEDKPFLPPRLESLRHYTDAKPPPLPPRNKSMEQVQEDKVSTGSKPAGQNVKVVEQSSCTSTADRRASVPNVGDANTTKMVRSTSGAKPGRKHAPRPTRKAPPPPSQPPSRPLSMTSQEKSSSAKEEAASNHADKVPGYQKILNGPVSAADDINTVVPKTGVVGDIDSPSGADISIDHDYHEIPDHLVAELTRNLAIAQEKQKDGTPPPHLPPRSYKPLPVQSSAADTAKSLSPHTDTTSDPSKTSSSDETNPSDGSSIINDSSKQESESCSLGAESETASQHNPEGISDRVSGEDSVPALNTSDGISEPVSGEDSTSQSSQHSSRPNSFYSEVLGSLLHVVGGQHRPISMHSGSSHSETGSGEAEVPTFDQSSGSESENEEDEERLKQKRDKKVYFIAEEVVKSEKVFVDVLKLLNVDFRVFMSTKTEQAGHPIVPAETLNKILDFLPQLQSFNEMLLKDLCDRIANWEKQKKIADIFVKKGPFLKLYSSYIRNFENATALLDETCKKHNGFGMALQQFEISPRCANLALKHYMLKPIQRIPQYKLLLQDYLKHLTNDSPDYKDTITALNIVSEVADHANESMRHGDNVQKMLEIQRSLIGQFEVIQPGRVLIKQGELMKLSRKEMQPRMFFLFSDVLLYTTPTATGYRLNNILQLQGMKVLPPKLDEFSNEFNIMTTQRSFTVATSTSEEREAWLRALWNAIEENSERYHTFKAMQNEPKTSLLDKDFVLGSKAPLWVPDARVTMCMVCLAEFSITWRRHHCRACGRIICGNCSENRAPLRYLAYKAARVCDECFERLAKEVDEGVQKEQKTLSDNAAASSPSPALKVTSASPSAGGGSADTSGLSFSSIKARFQKIRKSARERRKSGQARPSVLKEVHANDEGSDMSGYLWVAKNKKWKRLWFVVKGKVLYTYKASEDMAAIESMPLLGFDVTRMTIEEREALLPWYQGAEPDLMFELHHQNTQPLVFKPRSTSSSSSERSSVTEAPVSPISLSPHVKSSVDTTTPRLIFRTDSAAATTKWVTVLREASLA